jgi:hypothetical protein
VKVQNPKVQSKTVMTKIESEGRGPGFVVNPLVEGRVPRPAATKTLNG